MSAQIVSLDYISDPGVKKSVVILRMKKTKRARHCLFDERGIIDACLFVIDGSIRVRCNDFVTHTHTHTHTQHTHAHTHIDGNLDTGLLQLARGRCLRFTGRPGTE